MQNSQQFLASLQSLPRIHYLWLRSLSYLEYIGYRKMVKALSHHQVNQEVYAHLSDEIRHSFVLKQLAEKSRPENIAEDIFGPDLIAVAESYFQDLDASVKRWVLGQLGEDEPFLCYLLMSYLIEKRAMIVYPHYQASLANAAARAVIQQIIKEEHEHLSYLEGHIARHPGIAHFTQSEVWSYEDERFAKFLDSFTHCAQLAA